MNMKFPRLPLATLLCAIVCVTASSASHSASQESTIMQAHGDFDVKITPQKPDNPDAEAAGFARIALDKRYHGAIEGTGRGEMLASG
ncbi:MAG: DUF3224 domain-containing protein, partial [Xanthomonadales bacterium]|nr:DUF3224 domain-containing protein [Xanthomonadales bacterium]